MPQLNVIDLPFVEELIRLPSIDSTNTYAKSLARYPRDGLTVILADRQTAGRGQRGNSFFSSVDGGLWFTVVCPIQDLSDHFGYNRAMGMGVHDAITGNAPDAPLTIKWPNDIYWGDRKLCGMLLETAAHHLVIGVGINVNLAAEQFPPELRTIATSLLVETGRRWDRDDLLCGVLMRFWEHLHGDSAALHQRYHGMLYGMGREAVIAGAAGRFGEVLPDGRLGLDVDGRKVYFSSGPLRFTDSRGAP